LKTYIAASWQYCDHAYVIGAGGRPGAKTRSFEDISYIVIIRHAGAPAVVQCRLRHVDQCFDQIPNASMRDHNQ
jgi:hypothetical protein